VAGERGTYRRASGEAVLPDHPRRGAHALRRHPAHLIGGTFVDDDSGSTLQNLQLFALDAGKVVAVTGTAPAEAWDSYAAELDATVRSVALTT
jgi:hypothetical protein